MWDRFLFARISFLRLHSRRQSKLDEFIGAFTFYAALTDINFTVRCRLCHGYTFFCGQLKKIPRWTREFSQSSDMSIWRFCVRGVRKIKVKHFGEHLKVLGAEMANEVLPLALPSECRDRPCGY